MSTCHIDKRLISSVPSFTGLTTLVSPTVLSIARLPDFSLVIFSCFGVTLRASSSLSSRSLSDFLCFAMNSLLLVTLYHQLLQVLLSQEVMLLTLQRNSSPILAISAVLGDLATFFLGSFSSSFLAGFLPPSISSSTLARRLCKYSSLSSHHHRCRCLCPYGL